MKLFHTGETGAEELKNYISSNISFTIENMEPQINTVINKFVIDVLGKDEFDSLSDNFDDDTLTPEQELLLPYCQNIIANLAALSHTNIGAVYFSSMGISVPQSDKGLPASQWRLIDIKNDFAYTGFNAIEELLNFLWESTAGDYPDWESSDERANHRELFILTAKQYSKSFWIDDSYQLYRMLKPSIRMVEKYYVRQYLGKELYYEIKQQILDDDVSDENLVLLDDFIRPAVALLSFSDGAPRLRINVSDFGITERSIGDRQSIDVKKPASSESYSEGVMSSLSNGQTILTEMREYLFENFTDYPLYEESDAYASRLAEEEEIQEDGDDINNADDKVIGLF